MSALVLYALVAASVHYFLGYAVLVDRVRTRLPGAVREWLWCPFCSGFWYGAAIAVTIGRHQDLVLLGLPGDTWYTPAIAGTLTMITTPILIGLVFAQHATMQRYLTGAPEPVAEPTTPPDLRVV